MHPMRQMQNGCLHKLCIVIFPSNSRGKRSSHFAFEGGEQSKMAPLSSQFILHSSLLHYIPTSASHRDLSCPKQNGWSVENTHNLTGHPIYLCQPKGKIAAAFGCPSVGVSLTLVAETKISSIQLLPRKTKVP
jgi:hypothetical protein